MRQSNDLQFTKLRYPNLFGCTPAQGIRDTSGVIEELELLLAGVRRLRKSYTMKGLHDPAARGQTQQLVQEGRDAAARRFSAALVPATPLAAPPAAIYLATPTTPATYDTETADDSFPDLDDII